MIDPTYLISIADAFGIYGSPMCMLARSLALARIDKWRYAIGNSFDYTCLIDVIENDRDVGEHVVLLHDTMEVTPETPKLIEQADPDSGAVAAFGGQCNLGLFRMDYLLQRRDFILSLKGCSKKQAIEAEGRLWRECPTKTHYPNGDCVQGEWSRPYGGALRMREFYTALAIIKWKSNAGQTNESNYVLAP